LIEAKIGTADFTAAQNDLAAALQRQSSAAERVAPALDKNDAAAKKAGSTSRNTGMAMLEFSRAFEDAQYGMAGVLNNIPGLLGALGLGAGLAGMASVAAVVLSQTLPAAFGVLDEKLDISGKASDKRKEQAAKLNEELGKTVERAAAADFQKYLEGLKLVAEAQKLVGDRIRGELELQEQLRIAREKTAQSELQMQDALLRVQEGTGQISPEEAAKKREVIRKEMNEASLAASIAAVKETERRAQAEVEIAQINKLAVEGERDGILQEARRAEKKLQELEEKVATKKRELEEARHRDDQAYEARHADMFRATERVLGPAGADVARKLGRLIDRPKENLMQESEVALAKDEYRVMAKKIRDLYQEAEKKDATIQQAEQALISIADKLANTQKVVATKVENLESIATNNEVVEKAEGLQEKLEKKAEESAQAVEKLIEDVEPQSAKQKAALEVLKTALADGKVLPEETQKVTIALNELFAKYNENIQQTQQLLQINNQAISGIVRSLQTLQSQALSDREKVNGLLRSQSR
jgi:hypothetical protein